MQHFYSTKKHFYTRFFKLGFFFFSLWYINCRISSSIKETPVVIYLYWRTWFLRVLKKSFAAFIKFCGGGANCNAATILPTGKRTFFSIINWRVPTMWSCKTLQPSHNISAMRAFFWFSDFHCYNFVAVSLSSTVTSPGTAPAESATSIHCLSCLSSVQMNCVQIYKFSLINA